MTKKLLFVLLWVPTFLLMVLGVIASPQPPASPRIRAIRPKGHKAGLSLARRRRWYNLQSWGFLKYADQAAERISTIGIENINTAVFESVDLWQRELDEMLTNVVEKVTWPKRRYTLPNSGTLQPLDEHGNPYPRIPSGFYEVGLPIQAGGDAWGDNRISRAKMTIAEADRLTAMVTQADTDWMIRHILAAWFTNVTWTYDDPEHDVLTVQPLANGDTVEYVRRNGTVSTDNHFLGQAAAIADATNPYPTIYRELAEHPSNSGPFVAYIASNLVGATQLLAGFVDVDDPDISRGANSDVLVGDLGILFANEVIGKTDRMWVVEYDRLPDNYIIAQALGASGKPFAMREHPELELQGFFPEFQNVDSNRHLNKFLRFAGFGALNRVAALAMEISDASYDVPTGFLAPLHV